MDAAAEGAHMSLELLSVFCVSVDRFVNSLLLRARVFRVPALECIYSKFIGSPLSLTYALFGV
jgi:hypothetical protein